MEGDAIMKKYNFLNAKFGCQDRSLAIIKSNLMFKFKELTKEGGSELETGLSCCQWCLNTWSPELCSVNLRPQKNPKRRIRALMKKDLTMLNKYQQKLVAKLKSRVPGNILVFKCHICKKSTLVPMRKEKTETAHEEDDSLKFDEEVKKKKKRKRKDVFAGLNAVVLQNYKKPLDSALPVKSIKHASKKSAKKLSLQQQVRIHQALSQAPSVQKKKPSLLATFLDNM
uniref:Uncharacterized protein n=1 Tax=Graphocephala atropunctata TaxID=36148 RepID=A0A1B6LW72_9HEMI